MELTPDAAEAMDEIFDSIKVYIQETINDDKRLAACNKNGLPFGIYLRGMSEYLRGKSKHEQKSLISIAYNIMRMTAEEK